MTKFKVGDKVRQKQPFVYGGIDDSVGVVVPAGDYTFIEVLFADYDPDSFPFTSRELELVHE